MCPKEVFGHTQFLVLVRVLNEGVEYPVDEVECETQYKQRKHDRKQNEQACGNTVAQVSVGTIPNLAPNHLVAGRPEFVQRAPPLR